MANAIQDAVKESGGTEPAILRNFFAEGGGKGFLRFIGRGCLRSVHQNDVLYLVLHGAGRGGSEHIGATRNLVQRHDRGIPRWGAPESSNAEDFNKENLKKYTPDQIASVMEAEGLSKSFENLHLYTCGSALEGGENDKENRLSIAERVFAAMKALGYTRICVTGYLGNIRAGAMGRIGVDVMIGSRTNDWQLRSPKGNSVTYM